MSHSFPTLGFGLGLRAPHYEAVMNEKPKVDWFEVISDNYIAAHRGYWDYLTDLRSTYPIIMHGVALSIGSTEPLDQDYIKRLKVMADTLEVAWVSDHLCFTGVGGINTHDLLPIPYTEEALAHVVARVHHAQNALKRPLVLENPSSYLEFNGSTISEAVFLHELCIRTGCSILLDLNNIIVNSYNHGWDSKAYVDAIPASSIAQYHLAGHENRGAYLYDTHDCHVTKATWDLYAYALEKKGMRSTVVEWDNKIPALSELLAEVERARRTAAAVSEIVA